MYLDGSFYSLPLNDTTVSYHKAQAGPGVVLSPLSAVKPTVTEYFTKPFLNYALSVCVKWSQVCVSWEKSSVPILLQNDMCLSSFIFFSLLAYTSLSEKNDQVTFLDRKSSSN